MHQVTSQIEKGSAEPRFPDQQIQKHGGRLPIRCASKANAENVSIYVCAAAGYVALIPSDVLTSCSRCSPTVLPQCATICLLTLSKGIRALHLQLRIRYKWHYNGAAPTGSCSALNSFCPPPLPAQIPMLLCKLFGLLGSCMCRRSLTFEIPLHNVSVFPAPRLRYKQLTRSMHVTRNRHRATTWFRPLDTEYAPAIPVDVPEVGTRRARLKKLFKCTGHWYICQL